MTVWAYDLQADGEDLLDYCQSVIVETEYGMAEVRDAEFPAVGAHGTVYIPGALYGPGDVMIVCYLRETDPTGAVTHVDGTAGHIYENLANLTRLFGKVDQQISLTRTAPHQGATELLLKPAGQPSSGRNQFEVRFPMRASKPFWRSASVSTTLTGVFDPGGNAPVDDMVLTFGGAGTITNNRNDDSIQVTGACVVDCGKRTVTAGGSPAPGLIIPKNDRWMHLEPGNNAMSGSVGITYHPKWR